MGAAQDAIPRITETKPLMSYLAPALGRLLEVHWWRECCRHRDLFLDSSAELMDAEGRRAGLVVVVVVVWEGGIAFFFALSHRQLDYWPLMISSLRVGTVAWFVLVRRREPRARRPLPAAVDSIPKLVALSVLFAGLDVANYFLSVAIVGRTIALVQSAFMGVIWVMWFVLTARRIRPRS